MTGQTVVAQPDQKGLVGVAASTDILTVITSARGVTGINWQEIWRYRELLYFLTWRDVKIRYKQTVLGVAWAVLQPFLTMVVMSVFIGRLGGMSERTDGVPYPIFLYTAMLPWQFFANSINNSSASLVGSSNLITKVYFPRLIIPLASVGAAIVDFLVACVLLGGMMLFYQTPLSWQLLILPLFLTGVLLVATGVGSLLAALTVEYRDFRYVVPFMVQIWMYLSPVIYPPSIVPEQWRWVYFLNPMAGLIEGFRGVFLAQPLVWGNIAISLGISLLLFLGGAIYFRSVERRFADVI